MRLYGLLGGGGGGGGGGGNNAPLPPLKETLLHILSAMLDCSILLAITS